MQNIVVLNILAANKTSISYLRITIQNVMQNHTAKASCRQQVLKYTKLTPLASVILHRILRRILKLTPARGKRSIELQINNTSCLWNTTQNTMQNHSADPSWRQQKYWNIKKLTPLASEILCRILRRIILLTPAGGSGSIKTYKTSTSCLRNTTQNTTQNTVQNTSRILRRILHRIMCRILHRILRKIQGVLS